ncbi:40532_t:CDS:2, partial [Gigaspora margarita]
QNGSIIIYGGGTKNFTQVYPDLAILDVNTWEWSIPNIPQKDAPPSRLFHSTAIYENYMIVSFGRLASELTPTIIKLIYILDIRDYTWVTETTINNLGSTPVPNNPSSSISTLIIVVTIVAGIILIGS